MAYVLLQQVSSEFARANARKTLDHPIALKYLKDHVSEIDFRQLSQSSEDGCVFLWGAKLERQHQIDRMLPKQTLVLFRRGTRVFRIGLIDQLLVNIDLAERLWGRDTDGETWAIIYIMKKVRNVSIDARAINKLIDRSRDNNWQGMTSIDGERAERALAYVRADIERGAP